MIHSPGTPRIRTAAYCRVSTLEEVQNGSFEAQINHYIRQISADPRRQLAGIYGDHGASGRSTTKRPEFCQMIRDCEAGKIDAIFTKSISRFARNLPDCLRTVRKLQAMGISILFEKENIDTLNVSSELLLNILAAIAEAESISISQNIRWAYERRNAMGNPFHKAPYGYRRDPQTSRWYIHEGEAKLVRHAFAQANEGRCYRDIRADLNRMNAEAGHQWTWSHHRMLYMLTHEAYIGDVLTNKSFKTDIHTQIKNRGQQDQYYIEDHHAPIICRKLHARVSALVRGHLLHSGKNNFSPEEKAILSNTVCPCQMNMCPLGEIGGIP